MIRAMTTAIANGQYRVFFNDGYGLWLSIANQQPTVLLGLFR